MKGDEIVRPFDRHSNETATLRKHVTKYSNMRKLMLVFLGKFKNDGIKISGVNSIRISPNLSIYFNGVVMMSRKKNLNPQGDVILHNEAI